MTNKPLSAMEMAEKFHDCLRGNCSDHESYDDCQYAIAAEIQAVVEEAQISNNDFVFEVNRKARAEAYEDAAKIVENHWFTCNSEIPELIRAKVKELK